METKDAIKHLSWKISFAKQCSTHWADCVDVDALEIAVRAMAEERKKGKWIKKMRIIETDKYASYTPEWYCSCCGGGYKPCIAELISFCPNCGADMRGKTDE